MPYRRVIAMPRRVLSLRAAPLNDIAQIFYDVISAPIACRAAKVLFFFSLRHRFSQRIGFSCVVLSIRQRFVQGDFVEIEDGFRRLSRRVRRPQSVQRICMRIVQLPIGKSDLRIQIIPRGIAVFLGKFRQTMVALAHPLADRFFPAGSFPQAPLPGFDYIPYS